MTPTAPDSFRLEKSQAAFRRAQQVIPGGVNSPVRAFVAVGGTPPIIDRAEGSHLHDIDANEYVDYVMSWGPLILGHRDERVVAAIGKALRRGTSFGAATEMETELAEQIVAHVPSAKKVRLVNSGTEAVMSAVRLARAATGRDVVVKFAGCYHGHGDGFLVAAGSGATTLGIPSSPGVPHAYAELTAVLPYNDVAALRAFFADGGKEVAAVIVEPVAANMGVVPPVPGFLETLRRVTHDAGALLIFDEVITGFRLGLGGAQAKYGVSPDLTVLGKIIGGGLPVGAYCGPGHLMDQMAPVGPVYQAGTLAGNPLAVAAGLATLQALQAEGFYEALAEKTTALAQGFLDAAREARVPVTVNQVDSMFTLFFREAPVENYDDTLASDVERFAHFHQEMLCRGVYLAPSQFEALFLSAAHSAADIDATVAAARQAFAAVAGAR
jgi:glutamate-1-semialdehyde 2,1-aminomutase